MQVVMVDGFGILHPRQCGSASHLGVASGFPTIGVAKNILHWDGLNKANSSRPPACPASPAMGSTAAEPGLRVPSDVLLCLLIATSHKPDMEHVHCCMCCLP